MKVMMTPHKLNLAGAAPSGIITLINKWFEHAPKVGIEFVDPKADSFDLLAIHAGMSKEYSRDVPLVSHLHGLYWTADYQADLWEYKANRDVIDSIRYATEVTVPSSWVNETLQRDVHLNAHVLPHGIDWQEWTHSENNEGYILFNKNRAADVCDPKPVGELALRFPNLKFVSTFSPQGEYKNVKTIGIQPHSEMRRTIQKCGIYLATTKETFGIGILEAMASGRSVLGFNHGGAAHLVSHGISGYLARPGDYDDLARGLQYCLRHAKILGKNGSELVKQYTWERVVEQLYGVYTLAAEKRDATVSVVIPCFNYSSVLERAVKSVLNQTYPVEEIIIVNNNSTDDTYSVSTELSSKYKNVSFVNCPEQGVAHARNFGIRNTESKYVCCLDADDEVKPGFLEVCVKELERDSSLGLAYTRLESVDQAGFHSVSQWPGDYNFDNFVKRQNQVPTCCVFRRDIATRLGGYRQRYAPNGAGAEDAEFWFRMGEAGYGGRLATSEALFVYHLGGNVSGNRAYKEPDWLKFHPWTNGGGDPPFAAVSTPQNRLSHPVRQYDEPEISVIIPVGANHTHLLGDALDSLEAQTFKKWEVICVFDSCIVPPSLLVSHPYIRIESSSGKGAGAARNKGVKQARGEYLLFLDADDWLEPEALQVLLDTHKRTGMIAYSDYVGHAIINGELLHQLDREGRLLSYNPKNQEAQIAYQAFDYDCEIMLRQPEINERGEFYVWCNVSSLLPKRWHEEIGGFSEEMESWEDWHYWLKLARKGKCFTRVRQRLLNYRIYTGTRRSLANSESEPSRQLAQKLVQYIRSDFERGEKPVCGSCGGSSQPMQSPVPMMSAPANSPDEMIMVILNDGKRGDHGIVGHSTQKDYGYRRHGEEFLMHRRDLEMQPHLFILVHSGSPDKERGEEYVPEVKELEPPVPLVKADDLTLLWGVNEEKARKLNEMGIFTFLGITMAPEDMLTDLFSEKIVKRVKVEALKQLKTYASL